MAKEGNSFTDSQKRRRKNKRTSIGNSQNSRPKNKQFKKPKKGI